MKKIWYLSLAFLFFTGCQKHELSDLELVKIAREYMRVMNPGEVEKASASVSNLNSDFDCSKEKYVKYKEVSFIIPQATDRPPYLYSKWRLRIENDKVVGSLFMTPEDVQNDLQMAFSKVPIGQKKNCWGNYLGMPDWLIAQKTNRKK